MSRLREQLLETADALEDSHPELASILVTHPLEELPVTTTHAAVITAGRLVAAGSADEVVTTENITVAFRHPIEVHRHDGRWSARAARSRWSPAGVE